MTDIHDDTINTAALIGSLNAIRLGYRQKTWAPDPHKIIVPPYTRQDLNDLDFIRRETTRIEENLNFGILPTADDKTLLRHIKSLSDALLEKRDMRRGKTQPQDHISTHYIWRTRHDDKVRPEHAANDGKVFAWDSPPPTGNPGEAFGCRCWGEPRVESREGLEERVSQTVATYTTDSARAWNDDDLKYHYYNGNGRDIILGHIGLLQKVIDYARTRAQKNGGSIFDRVARKIFIEARLGGEGSFKFTFGTDYDFSDLLYSFGDSTVEGDAQVNVVEGGEFLIITANIHYTFWDEYKDPFDLWDILPIDIEDPRGNPYKITDTWDARLEAIIQKDSEQSRYPNNEFGELY